MKLMMLTQTPEETHNHLVMLEILPECAQHDETQTYLGFNKYNYIR